MNIHLLNKHNISLSIRDLTTPKNSHFKPFYGKYFPFAPPLVVLGKFLFPLHKNIIFFIFMFLSSTSFGEMKYPTLRFKSIENSELNSIGDQYTTIQDTQGFMWFGGSSGLARYDGNNVRIYRYNPDDKRSLSANYVHDLLVDKKNRLWVATRGGGLNLYIPEKDSFIRFQYESNNPNSLSHNEVNALFERTDGTIWIATRGGGLNLFNPEKQNFTRYQRQDNIPDKISSNQLRAIHEDRNGFLWIGTYDSGLIRFDIKNKVFTQYQHSPQMQNGLSHNYVWDIHEDRHGRLWVATFAGGLDQLNKNTGEFTHHLKELAESPILGKNRITNIEEDETSTLWLGTEEGLFLYDPSTKNLESYLLDANDPGSLPKNKVTSLYQDRDDDWWFGHFPYGVSRLDRHASTLRNYFHIPHNKNTLSHNGILALDEDIQGNIWIGTEGGLNYLNTQTNTIIRYLHDPKNPNSLPAPTVSAILEDSYGTIWVGTFGGGLSQFDSKTKKFYRMQMEANIALNSHNDIVWTIYEDKLKDIWIGTHVGGLKRYDRKDNQFTSYKSNRLNQTSITSGVVLSIFEDSHDNFWVGTGTGLNLMDRKKGTFQRFQYKEGSPNGLSANGIWCITEDHFGNLWLGTSGGGLNKLDRKTGKFISYQVKDGLPNNTVTGIVEDNGFLWLSTEHGLSKFNPKTSEFKNYDKQHGFPDNLYNRPASLKTINGELVFGSSGGLTFFDPKRLFEDKSYPPVVLTELQLFNRPVNIAEKNSPLQKALPYTKAITLNSSQSVFSLTFAALHYRSPQKNQYAYWLEGFDRDWNFVGNSQVATYTNLDPGDYIFHVKAANSEGIWNPKSRSLKISILPPWWRTTWAYCFYILISLSLTSTFIRTYQRKLSFEKTLNTKLREAEVELEKKVEQRTLQLKKAKYQAEKAMQDAEKEKQHAEQEKQSAEFSNRAKSTFLANMSHEIRTPMNAVLGYAQILQRDERLLPEQHQATEAIENAGNHLLDLINDVLDISKIEAGGMELHPQDFDLIAMLEAVSQMFSIRCKQKHLSWYFENSCEKYVPVKGDQAKLRQVLINLLGNAVKFTENGSVTLSVQEIQSDHYRFDVIDTGPGIDAKNANTIFEPFHQTKAGSEKGGTGLGLAIAHKHVELMSSELQLASTDGGGCRFFFTIKLPESKQTTSDLSHSVRQVAHLGIGMQPRILVVDDIATNRDVLKLILKNIGAKVEEASSGQETLDILRDSPSSEWPDLIFLDIRMPNMDGFETLKKIKERYYGLAPQCVAITASALQYDRTHFLRYGFVDFITKPYLVETICECIHNLLNLSFDYQSLEKYQPHNEPFDAATLTIPTHLSKQLKEAAHDYEVAKLETAIKTLENLGANEKSFAEILWKLLSRYEMDALLNELNKVCIDE